ncbi:MAG: hypothetical protein ACTSPD_17420 [Promethearchaeota archaeon]
METIDKLNYFTAVLFLTTGILHIIQPIIFGLNLETTGEMIFGIIYTSLGILIFMWKDNRIIAILSIVLPIFGMTIAIVGLIVVYFSLIVFSLILLDVVIIPLRIYIYEQLKKT